MTAHINFQRKRSILANIDDQDKAVKTSNKSIKDTYEFIKKPPDEDNFEEQIVEDILNDDCYKYK